MQPPTGERPEENIYSTRLRQAAKAPQPAVHSLKLLQFFPQRCAVDLTMLPIVVGRSGDLVIDDPSVSRQHFRIFEQNQNLWLQDLGSANGITINRVACGQNIMQVCVGDVIRAGDVLMRLIRPQNELATLTTDKHTPLLIGGTALDGVRRQIRLLAPTELRLLIRGESGTGKELVARSIHQQGGRQGPLISLNCAAIPESLIETELFGHVRGAFTGAVRDKPGLFEAARDGTLFLDEITEMPLPSQAKLLRVVETGELRRVGDVRAIKTNCRILSATNRPLEQDVSNGRFRADLAARLAETTISLPPLRDRLEDVPLLIEHLSRRSGKPLPLTADALEYLCTYAWPLNVRELDNLVRMLEVMAAGQPVTPQLLPPHITQPVMLQEHTNVEQANTRPPAAGPGHRVNKKIETVLQLLKQHDGNVRRTAEVLGVSRTYIYRCLDKSGTDPKLLRPGM